MTARSKEMGTKGIGEQAPTSPDPTPILPDAKGIREQAPTSPDPTPISPDSKGIGEQAPTP
jgi:hypothetical protein